MSYEACFVNHHDLNTDSNYLSIKVLLLCYSFCEMNSVLCLTFKLYSKNV